MNCPIPLAPRAAATALAFVFLFAPFGGFTFAARHKSGPFDPGLRPGVRISVKGDLLADGSLQADEIELRDEKDDDHELRGRIDTVDLSAGRFVLLGVTVVFDDETRFTREPDTASEAGELKTGLRVKVDGERREDGSFFADKVKIRRNQQYDERRIVGSIKSLKPGPTGTLLLTVVGFLVRADAATELIGGATRGSRPAVRRRPGVVDNEDDLVFMRPGRTRRRLQLAGEIRLRSESLDNLNLDREDDKDEATAQVFVRLGAALDLTTVFAYAELLGVREFVLESPDPFADTDNEVRIGEAYVQFRGVGSSAVSVVIGRQKFDEEREWFYNKKSLDAVRVLGNWRRFSFDLSVSSNVFDSTRNRNDQEHTNIIFQAVYRPARKVEIQTFFIERQDDTEREDSPRYLGLRLLGEYGRHLEYWVDLAHDRGRRGLFDPSTESYFPRDVRASAADLGVTYRPRIRLDPSFTAGWAHGDGEPDPDEATPLSAIAATTDGTFRQSGLERNRWKYNGVVSFRYYGEVLDPELSNIDILSLSTGLRPTRTFSIDLLYHRYRQDQPSRIVRGELDDRPNGVDRDLGSEWDLALGYEPSRRFELRATAGLFLPGSAFAGDATRARVARLQLKFRF